MAFEIEEPKYVLKLSMALSFLPNRNLQLLFSSKHNVRSPVLACGLLDEGLPRSRVIAGALVHGAVGEDRALCCGTGVFWWAVGALLCPMAL